MIIPGTGHSVWPGRPAVGRLVLADRLPKCLERAAYLATASRLGRYDRTYPAYVEDEVKAALDEPRQPVPARTGNPHRARHRDRRHACLHRDRPQLVVRALARCRLPIRPPLRWPPSLSTQANHCGP